jgi:small subunit ribosomal protein S6
MVIFDATTEPPAIQAVVDRVLETVRSTGGNPGAIDRWGRRTFAYEVNHKREGYYLLVEFAAGVQTVADVDRMLSLADEVIRHKVIRLPEGGTGRTRRRSGSESAAPSRGSHRPGPARVDAGSPPE